MKKSSKKSNSTKSAFSSWVGTADLFDGETAHVTLYDKSTGETFTAECKAALLHSRGVCQPNDQFRLMLVKDRLQVRKLAPKPISRRRVRQIVAEMKRRFPDLSDLKFV